MPWEASKSADGRRCSIDSSDSAVRWRCSACTFSAIGTLGCLVERWGFHDDLLFSTLWPLLAALLLLALGELGFGRARCAHVALFLSFVVFPSASTTVFDAFRCEGCPHRGKPAFEPGDELKLAESMMKTMPMTNPNIVRAKDESTAPASKDAPDT